MNMELQRDRLRSARRKMRSLSVHKVTVAELVQGEILGQTDTQMQEKLLKEWDSNRIYDEEIHKLLEKRFSYQYPHAYLKEIFR